MKFIKDCIRRMKTEGRYKTIPPSLNTLHLSVAWMKENRSAIQSSTDPTSKVASPSLGECGSRAVATIFLEHGGAGVGRGEWGLRRLQASHWENIRPPLLPVAALAHFLSHGFAVILNRSQMPLHTVLAGDSESQATLTHPPGDLLDHSPCLICHLTSQCQIHFLSSRICFFP